MKEELFGTMLLYDALEKKAMSFRALLRILKKQQNSFTKLTSFCDSLGSESFFPEMIEQHLIDQNDIKHLLSNIKDSAELSVLCLNTPLLKCFIEKGYLNFSDFVSKLHRRSIQDHSSCLFNLVSNERFFIEAFESNLLTNDDVMKLFQEINQSEIFEHLCNFNESLFMRILENFMFDKKILNNLRYIFDIMKFDLEQHNIEIKDIFDLIEFYQTHIFDSVDLVWIEKEPKKINPALMRFIQMNKDLQRLDITEDQLLELYKVLNENENARKGFCFLYDNHLESTFDNFDSLMNYLKKQRKKQHALNI